MGILDEAIREHLELKRQHGAGDSELKRLEDEAFGPPERPGAEAADSFAEAPTEFMAQPPGTDEAGPPETAEGLMPRRRAPDIADLQEAPEPPPAAEQEEPAAEQGEEEREERAEPSTEERQAIAEQPTELYDVEGEIAESEPEPDGEEPDEEDDDFWDEQRLSDELDQALEAPEEDLLEETPDFLEEAPEDDQLWFEQKPPKDFDFDD